MRPSIIPTTGRVWADCLCEVEPFDAAVVADLVARGGDPNHGSDVLGGWTPLHHAVTLMHQYRGRGTHAVAARAAVLGGILALIAAGADPSEGGSHETLRLAVKHGVPEAVTVLIAAGVDPDATVRWSFNNERRRIPLLLDGLRSSGSGTPTAGVIALLEAGAGPAAIAGLSPGDVDQNLLHGLKRLIGRSPRARVIDRLVRSIAAGSDPRIENRRVGLLRDFDDAGLRWVAAIAAANMHRPWGMGLMAAVGQTSPMTATATH